MRFFYFCLIQPIKANPIWSHCTALRITELQLLNSARRVDLPKSARLTNSGKHWGKTSFIIAEYINTAGKRYKHGQQISKNWKKLNKWCTMLYLKDKRVLTVCDWWKLHIMDSHPLHKTSMTRSSFSLVLTREFT